MQEGESKSREGEKKELEGGVGTDGKGACCRKSPVSGHDGTL